MKITTEYIAGFFDGEGSIGFYGKRLSLRACITQARTPESDRLFRRLQSRYGGSIYYAKRYKPSHRPSMMWSVFANVAVRFLGDIVDSLVLKKNQALLAMRWQRARSTKPRARDASGGPFVASSFTAAQLRLIDKINAMKRTTTKGPRKA